MSEPCKQCEEGIAIVNKHGDDEYTCPMCGAEWNLVEHWYRRQREALCVGDGRELCAKEENAAEAACCCLATVRADQEKKTETICHACSTVWRKLGGDWYQGSHCPECVLCAQEAETAGHQQAVCSACGAVLAKVVSHGKWIMAHGGKKL